MEFPVVIAKIAQFLRKEGSAQGAPLNYKKTLNRCSKERHLHESFEGKPEPGSTVFPRRRSFVLDLFLP